MGVDYSDQIMKEFNWQAIKTAPCQIGDRLKVVDVLLDWFEPGPIVKVAVQLWNPRTKKTISLVLEQTLFDPADLESPEQIPERFADQLGLPIEEVTARRVKLGVPTQL